MPLRDSTTPTRSRQRRRRGVLLSDRGLSRVQGGQRRLALENDGSRVSLEAFSAAVGLSTRTLSRVLSRESPVDLRTLETFFFALGLELAVSDYENASGAMQDRWPTHQLPVHLSSLIGRDELLERLVALANYSRLLTLTGPGGIGKTRLAVEIARRLEAASEARIWFVDLSMATNERESISSVATALGLPVSSSGALIDIRERLRTEPGLLLLDNCENAVEPLGPFVVRLLRTLPSLRVIATSREPFAVEGEHVFRIPPLEMPETLTRSTASNALSYPAVSLFVERAIAHNASFVFDDSVAPAVCAIVLRLDGLPLAIELAAAQSDVMATADLLKYLRNNVINLESQGTERDPRHRSIQALFDWSFERLSASEQVVCRRASVFTGSFDEAALQAVSCDGLTPAAVGDVARGLVRKSLLEIDVHAGRTRFSFLMTVGECARERLEASGEAAFAHWLHALHYLHVAGDVMRSFGADDLTESLRSLTPEFANVRAALDWSFVRTHNEYIGAALVAELPEYFDARGQYSEGEAWIRRALTIDAELLQQVTCAKLFEGLSLILFRQKRLAEAAEAAASSVASFAAVANDVGLCRAHNLLGIIALDAGDVETARAEFWANLERGEMLNNPRVRIVALNNLGRVEAEVDRAWLVALGRFQQSLELAIGVRLNTMVATALRNIGETYANLGDLPLAITFSRRSMVAARELENDALHCITAMNTAIYRMQAGGYESALPDFRHALDAIANDPYRIELCDHLDLLAALLIASGEPERAVTLLTATAAQRLRNGEPSHSTSFQRHGELVDRARRRLGGQAYENVRAAALGLSIEAAFRDALLTPKDDRPKRR